MERERENVQSAECKHKYYDTKRTEQDKKQISKSISNHDNNR
jgi:hypothetical protein